MSPKSRSLVLVGGGGFALEVVQWLKDIGDYKLVVGVLDDNRNCPAVSKAGLSWLGTIDEASDHTANLFVCCLGNPKTKIAVLPKLRDRGCEFYTLAHPSALIGETVALGDGVVICPYVIVSANVQIGDFVVLNGAATVGHDAVIGDGSTLSAHCDVTGGGVLGTAVFMGSHAVVAPGVSVPANSSVGAGSVMLKNGVKSGVYFGVPARWVSA